MVIWTDNAISHITEFIEEARKGTEQNAKAYMKKLVEYIDILETMPEIGKHIDGFVIEYDVRQIVYKKHRIIYSIQEKNCVILAVLHTKLDVNKSFNKLKKDIEKEQ